LELLQTSDNNEKYYIYNICSNSNDESIDVVILVLVSESVLFIADISVIGISVNLLIIAPLELSVHSKIALTNDTEANRSLLIDKRLLGYYGQCSNYLIIVFYSILFHC